MHFDPSLPVEHDVHGYHALHLEQVAQMSGCVIGEVADFRHRLQTIQAVSLNEFGLTFIEGSHSSQYEMIPVGGIIGTYSEDDRNWDFCDQGLTTVERERYVWDYAKKIQQGLFLLNTEAPELYVQEFCGLYFVTSNGRHRTAALKGMVGSELHVKARVSRCTSIDTVIARAPLGTVEYHDDTIHFSDEALASPLTFENSIPVLEQRRRDGLWSGTLVELAQVPHPFGGPDHIRAVWHSPTLNVLWAFAKDLELAQSVVNASAAAS